MLKQRVISGLIMLPLAVIAILSGPIYFNLLFCAVVVMMAWEWEHMVLGGHTSAYAVALGVLGAVCLTFNLQYWGLVFGALVLCALVIFAFAYKEKQPHRFLLTFGVFYIGLFCLALNILCKSMSNWGFLWLFAIVWACDIGGYIFGKSIGGPKLCEKISPKKTWSGFLGSLLLACVFSFVYTRALGFEWRGVYVMTVILGVVAQIGDILESAIKRYLGVKDSSNLIPGHGGIFDRIDALMLVMVAYALFYVMDAYGFISIMVY